MIRVQIDDLSKSYDKVAALDRVSLDVRPGERFVVLGPSGAGKTALGRLVAGLDTPDSGEIRFDGRSQNGVDPSARKVGFIPRGDALWPHRTVGENVGYALRIQGIGRRERRVRVAEALGAARIDSLADRYPEALAPIQRRKVALARALVSEPQLLLLDEPMEGLDPRGRSELRDEVRRIQAEGEATAIVFTSDPREALALADRLAVLDFGHVLQVGPPGEVYNRPADSLVAQLLGVTNLIQGQAESIDGRGDVVVRTPLGRLVGRPSRDDRPAVGAPVTIAIRPEALGIGPGVPADANRFHATVERTVLLGATRQVYLRGPGDWPITALALQAASDGLREGQGLTVSVHPEFVIVLSGRAPSDE